MLYHKTKFALLEQTAHSVGCSFDINENVSEIVEVINDVNYTTGYVLDNDSRMTEMTQG